ncbi:MAG: siroheme synthase CysG [Proteobacteria bacterium]|nr:siroheme synthase CysG [Pseudomonadota bacterium]
MSARKPETAAARIAPIATLPVFHKLAGRKVVLAGAGEAALWKAELILAAGAELHLFAPDLPVNLEGLSPQPGGGLFPQPRHWAPEDLDGAALALAEAEDNEEAAAFAAAAHARGIPVNVIDRPEFCDFQFGSIVNRSPLLVAISTDGAAPVFAQAIRAKIEALLPRGLKSWAEAARDWRSAVTERAPAFARRRRFWEAFTKMALAKPEEAPEPSDLADLLAGLDADTDRPRGQVTFVGAGPGDPDLLTLKAVRALQSADIILFDDLVAPEILDLARREAKRMLVGKKGHGPSCKQEEINALMVSLARNGRHVVRLKSGDPAIFGRLAEELDACHEAGIPTRIVPGITSAQGAAATLGVSLTERRIARRIQFVTGHDEAGNLPVDLSAAALGDPKASTILYMPKKTFPAFAARAMTEGLPGSTPAIAVINATRPDETRIAATLDTLGAAIASAEMEGPMLIMIGAAFRARNSEAISSPLAEPVRGAA